MVPDGNDPKFPTHPDGKRHLQDRDHRDTWKDMEKLVESGRAKAIGVCNYDIHHLKELQASSKTVPVINQVECHPYLRTPKLQKYCAQQGIHFSAYSP